MISLGILGSTRGTNMLAIIEAIQHKQLQAEIKIVISNKAEAIILERAKANNLPAVFLSAQGLNRDEYDRELSAMLRHYKVDLLVLTGYMRILSSSFVSEWEDKIINVHPSLLPAFAGKMDLEVHHAVLSACLKETGCTVHRVTQDVDAGPILLQKKCIVTETDTPEILKQRVQELEGKALVEAISFFENDSSAQKARLRITE